EMLATIFRRPVNTVRLAISTFEKFGMVEVINDVITIPNWSKHQSLDQIENRKEYMRNYMKEYRQKQKEIAGGEGKFKKKNKCKTKSKVYSKTKSKSNVNSLEGEGELEEELDIDKDIYRKIVAYLNKK